MSERLAKYDGGPPKYEPVGVLRFHTATTASTAATTTRSSRMPRNQNAGPGPASYTIVNDSLPRRATRREDAPV